MNGFLFGIIFTQVSVVFIAGVVVSYIFYKGYMNKLTKAEVRRPIFRRVRRSHASCM